MRCANCGNEIPGKMRFCPICGTPADAPASYDRDYDAGYPEYEGGYGADYEEGYGEGTDPGGIHVCGNCGSPLEYGDAFCCVCGTPVHWDSAEEGTDVNPASAAPERWRPAEDDEPTSVIEHREEYPGMEELPPEDEPAEVTDRPCERVSGGYGDRPVYRREKETDPYMDRRPAGYDRGAERIPAAGDFAPERRPMTDPRISAEPAALKGSLVTGHVSTPAGADVDDGEFFSAPGDFE